MASGGQEALASFEGQHIIREIIQLFVIEWELGHEGSGRNGLRIFEMLEMPFSIRASICNIGKIRCDIGAISMNAVTGLTLELVHQGYSPRNGGILLWNCIQLLERYTEQGKHDDQKPKADPEHHRSGGRSPFSIAIQEGQQEQAGKKHCGKKPCGKRS